MNESSQADAALVVMSGGRIGEHVAIGSDPVTIGSGLGASVCLDDPRLPAVLLVVERDGEGIWARPAAPGPSAVTARVDGAVLRARTRLSAGTTLEVGATELRFVVGAEARAAARGRSSVRKRPDIATPAVQKAVYQDRQGAATLVFLKGTSADGTARFDRLERETEASPSATAAPPAPPAPRVAAAPVAPPPPAPVAPPPPAPQPAPPPPQRPSQRFAPTVNLQLALTADPVAGTVARDTAEAPSIGSGGAPPTDTLPSEPGGLRLVVRSGPGTGRRVALEVGKRYVVGRAPDVEISIGDHAMSRRHCAFFYEGGRLVVEDLGSANGTKVGGVETRRRVLEAGEEIEVGSTRLRIEERHADASGADAALVGRLRASGAETQALFAAAADRIAALEALLAAERTAHLEEVRELQKRVADVEKLRAVNDAEHERAMAQLRADLDEAMGESGSASHRLRALEERLRGVDDVESSLRRELEVSREELARRRAEGEWARRVLGDPDDDTSTGIGRTKGR